VLRLAKLAERSGCPGVLSSPVEIQILRKTLPSVLLIVTPGIRPVDTENGDQNRKGTPVQAIKDGASYIIVGRPIVNAPNPAEVAKK